MASTIWKRWAGLLAWGMACLWLAPAAQAQTEPPGRVARLSLLDAAPMVEWSPAGTQDWQSADPNWPLTTGDRIRVPAAGRAELHAGSTGLRLQGPALLEIAELNDDNLRLTLGEGSLHLTVRSIAPDERIEVGTRNLAAVVTQPGEFRVDVDPATDTTRVALRLGAATVYGEGGEAQPLLQQQQVRYTGRRLLAIGAQGSGARDALDAWAADRNLAEEQSQSARYLPREAIGYQDLDQHGEWTSDAQYGSVWIPRVTVVDWAPYRYGQWRWIAPWGWTWIDDAPWGFAPFHYGRWIQLGPRWAWAPGPLGRRPAWAPALVGFEGPPLPRPGFGRPQHPGVPWFPLAPGEAWRPPFAGSPRYLDRVNRGLPPPPPRFFYQGRPQAISSAPQRDPRWQDREHWRGRDERAGRPAMPAPSFTPPGPQPSFGPAGPGPSFRPPPGGPRFGEPARDQAELEQRARQQREQMEQRERWQREQQQERERRIREDGRADLQSQQDRMRREQMQREWSARQQQRDVQEQQSRQQRDMQQRQERQERQMDEQRERQQRMQRDMQSDGPRRAPPPRTAIQERPGEPVPRGGRPQ